MRVKKFRYFVGDFETTVYEGQEHTEVWASAVVELNTENVIIHHSLGDTFDYLASLKTNIVIYYHNLKFDGSFWLDFLLIQRGLKQAYEELDDEHGFVKWQSEKEMKNNTFKYSISDMGQWYNIIIKINNKIIEIRDSLKLLPFSAERIGKSFKTKHKKLTMEYTGFRYSGCEITPEEREYIANDVLVIKEALEIMYQEGHDRLTIGSCCLEEFKKLTGKEDYALYFPDVYEIELDETKHRYKTAGDWIRKSYKGGWCYLAKGKENKLYHNGTTADVNSLYPSMMHSESGNIFPVSRPYFWEGDRIPIDAIAPNKYYFVRIKTRFYLKHGYLPFIQIKGNPLYKSTECLSSTDIYDPETGKYYTEYIDLKGNQRDTRVELTLTMTDYILMKEHYHLVDFEILDGCWFYAESGIFDRYIDKYKEIKINSEGALRELAKLFLNNLYGKMASNKDSSFKVAFEKEDGTLGFRYIPENEKKPGYIPIGSAITSYARNFTIRAAQKNYHGVDKAGFIYADTDSIHCDLPADQIVGITAHDKNFCCWKLEASWDTAWFSRQKTYIEHIVAENLKPVETPYYSLKCAGMPKKCKDLFLKSMGGITEDELKEHTPEEQEFLSKKRTIADFTVGLCVPGKLRPKRIRGGILLVETTYEMR